MKAYIPVLFFGTLVLVASCQKSAKGPAEGLETIDVAVPEVKTVVLHKSYPGTMSALQEADIVARVDGNLMSMNYGSGDFVKEGTVLFTIEDRNYRDAVSRAQAALETARSSYQYASSRYEAMKKALESDAVSAMEVQQAKSAMEQAEADIKSATAALQTANTSLSYCTIRAPFDGHVTSNTFDVGSYISGAAAPQTLARIYHDSEMSLTFSIEDAGFLGEMRNYYADNKALFDSIPVSFSEPLAHKYTGKLYYMAPNIDTSTGTMNLKCEVLNPYGELRSGMYTTVNLPYGVDSAAVLIRDSAISSDQLGSYVYVVNDSNKVEYTTITTGELIDDTLRIVNSGLTPESRYVTKALLKVRDGMEVNPRMTK